MKKAFAILLLFTHLFNICGYRLFFSFAEKVANEQIVASLDENKYDERDLIQIKVALNMPYLTSTGSDERCDGQIEMNGVHYNYVKRRVLNDTLYLYCIPNESKTTIANTKSSYARQSADNQSGKTSEQSVIKKLSVNSEYSSNVLGFNIEAYNSSATRAIVPNSLTTLKGFATKHLQPPDLFV